MRFAADENFDGRILKGILTRLPDIDIVRVQDTEMFQSSDPELLDWIADENRILLTHDVKTIPRFAYERVRAGLSVPGIIEVRLTISIGQILDELEVLIGAGTPEDFENIIRYVPMG
ncbi:MAG: DUF5615 family PIN-like protein [Anaerolineae bacterium]|nr:DUF5615 family PIN-like protein [Anaerolineae bacterium]MDQ7036690.1 DUF5615 family PIN-like protein [Anaerolineae bacterium]